MFLGGLQSEVQFYSVRKKLAGRLKRLNLIITPVAKLQPYLSREMRDRRERGLGT